MSYIIFDGHKIGNLSTGDTGWEASVFPIQIDSTPSREFEVYEPVGRIGNIIIDNKRYADVEQSYWVVVRENADAAFHEIAGFLQSRTGYCRLSDSWHADEYYQAYISEPIEPIFDKNRETVKFVVYFTRKPQRFLTSGEISVVTSTAQEDTGHFTNPTAFDAMPVIEWTAGQAYGSTQAVPLLYIYGDTNGVASPLLHTVGFYASDGVGNHIDNNATVTIDFGAYSAYKGIGANLNWGEYNVNKWLLITDRSSSFIPSSSKDFFALPGSTKLHFAVPAGISNLKLYPRWWRL